MGHVRLSIIDLTGGAQPLANEDESVWVVCNGEIYNYIELKQALESRGHRFRTQSDVEVLVHLYEDHGAGLLERIDGMYAFAILDEKNNRLFMARDRFGEKPLYYSFLPSRSGVLFASEMKALIAHPSADTVLDVAAVAQFLRLDCIPAPRTHRKGIRKLRAGESLIVDSGGLMTSEYWKPSMPKQREGIQAEDAVAEIRTRLKESVRLRLRSDVPVGAFLSGGIDSTAIVCAARELLPGAKLDTFCAVFDGSELDESRYARIVSERLGTAHHEVRISSEELLASFGEMIRHYDEPFSDPSLFPTYAVCREARRICKVMLSGDGGDELFAGYRDIYGYYRWRDLRHIPGVAGAASLLRRFRGEGKRGSGLLRYLSSSDWDLLNAGFEPMNILGSIHPEARGEALAGLAELDARMASHNRLPHPLSSMEAAAAGYLPEQVLVKVDRASMKTALESRAPFLNPDLLKFAWGLPTDLHFARGMGKALLRMSLPDWVPEDIRWRDKRGFTPPLAHWLRTSLKSYVNDSLNDKDNGLWGFASPDRARSLFREHLVGVDRSQELFRWLALLEHCRKG